MNTLKIKRRNGYAVVELNQGKVNAINNELAKDLLDFFTNATTDNTIKGVILTGRPHCFSAGLDIFKIATGGAKGLEIFWRNYLAALQTMVRFPKPFICAITGFAPAGGTVLTCCADYRIMGRGKKHKIGMHEIAISLQIPELLCRIYGHWIGDKTAMEYVMNGRLMQADEAVKIGLVNEACEVEEVLPKAEQMMQQWLTCYQPVLERTKLYFRKNFIEKVDMDMDEMINDILSEWGDPVYMERMVQFAASLKRKKGK